MPPLLCSRKLESLSAAWSPGHRCISSGNQGEHNLGGATEKGWKVTNKEHNTCGRNKPFCVSHQFYFMLPCSNHTHIYTHTLLTELYCSMWRKCDCETLLFILCWTTTKKMGILIMFEVRAFKEYLNYHYIYSFSVREIFFLNFSAFYCSNPEPSLLSGLCF